MKPMPDTRLGMLGERREEVIGCRGIEQTDKHMLTHLSVGMMNEEETLVILLIGHHAVEK